MYVPQRQRLPPRPFFTSSMLGLGCSERKPCAMSAENDPPIPDPFGDAGGLTRGRFTYFPVVPGRLEFAIEVRAAILRLRPEVIAVELPATLQPAWTRAVERLPASVRGGRRAGHAKAARSCSCVPPGTTPQSG